ncbi:MAG: AbrB/MazE/SpoVT family DNA-binding domain-containing protein [Micropepsaceae bacterium]
MGAVTSKGQVTIPKLMRDHLGVKPGTEVDFQINAAGEVVLVAKGKRRKSRFAHLVGSAKGKGPNMTTDEIMALTRGE